MDRRKEELNKLKSYTNEIDNDLTMILQTLQWDRKHILEHANMTTCLYNSNHKVLSTKIQEHQKECLLRQNGYTRNDQFLPEPGDTDVSTLIKLDKQGISIIIDNASKSDPTFKRGLGCGVLEPLTLDRLQCTYSSDERRAIHDAVVSAAPSCHDLTDLALPSTNDADETPKTKSRMEILAELRDMRRRRTKYRVAAKSRNYSDVLRDVIKTQMEHYTGTIGDVKLDVDQTNTNINKETEHNDNLGNDDGKKEHAREFSRPDSRDDGREQKERERSNRDYRSMGEKESRSVGYERADRRQEDNRKRSNSRRDDYRHRDRSREMKRIDMRENKADSERTKDYSENNHPNEKHQRKETRRDDYKYRDRSREVKREDMNADDADTNRSNKYFKPDYSHEKHKYRERYSERKDFQLDRESRNISREYGEESNRVRKDGSAYHTRDKEDDRERARSLITAIKKEIESVERDKGSDRGREASGVTTQIKQDQSTGSGHYKYNEKERNSRYKNSDAESFRNSENNFKHRREDYNRHRQEDRDQRRSSNKRNSSYRDRSREDERKRSRAEDKHRIYSEIYSELYNKRNKSEN